MLDQKHCFAAEFLLQMNSQIRSHVGLVHAPVHERTGDEGTHVVLELRVLDDVSEVDALKPRNGFTCKALIRRAVDKAVIRNEGMRPQQPAGIDVVGLAGGFRLIEKFGKWPAGQSLDASHAPAAAWFSLENERQYSHSERRRVRGSRKTVMRRAAGRPCTRVEYANCP